MNEINYVVGDATAPQGEGIKIICHICNDIGAWGAGFVMAISRKWSKPEAHYRAKKEYELGTVDFIAVTEDILVANMIGQHEVISMLKKDDKPPIRYDAVSEALSIVNLMAIKMNATLHMPRIGCGLAGGDWSRIEEIIKTHTTVPVFVYDLP